MALASSRRSELQAAKSGALGLTEERGVESEAGGLKSKIAGAFKGIGSSLGNFGLPFTEQFNKMGESIDKANTKAGSFKQTLGSIGQISVEAGVVGIVGVGAESIHLADEYETALSQLTTAIKASGGSLKEFEPASEGCRQSHGWARVQLDPDRAGAARSSQQQQTTRRRQSAISGSLPTSLASGTSASPTQPARLPRFTPATRACSRNGASTSTSASGKLHSIQSAHEAVEKAVLSLDRAQRAAARPA